MFDWKSSKQLSVAFSPFFKKFCIEKNAQGTIGLGIGFISTSVSASILTLTYSGGLFKRRNFSLGENMCRGFCEVGMEYYRGSEIARLSNLVEGGIKWFGLLIA